MIELMVVMVIIVILAGMLLPVLGSARRTARIAQVTTEIKNLEAGISNFKLKFGMDPPSSFRIRESGSYTLTDSLDKSSVVLMGQLWPDFPVNTATDLNADGDSNDVFTMNGAECLVFFLGGPSVISAPGNASPGSMPNSAPLGFSSNPTKPFQDGGTRVGPFMEFVTGRFMDLDADGVPEYLDPLPGQLMPYQYLSSYQGRGYRTGTDLTNEVLPSTLTSAYFQTVRGTAAPFTVGFWNPKSYQIISPGIDGEYGTGGGYRESKFFNLDATQTPRTAPRETDNITNFSAGALQ